MDVCIIGAGSSGISSCQVLKTRGIEFDCFEKGSNVGGLWRYGNDSGLSSAYSSLYINTSRKVMEYKAYPMPADYPDYPHHSQIPAYFADYVDHLAHPGLPPPDPVRRVLRLLRRPLRPARPHPLPQGGDRRPARRWRRRLGRDD